MSIPSWASNYVGVPFLDGGESFEGADCWGLLCMVLEREYGVLVNDFECRPQYGTKPEEIEAVRRFGEMHTKSSQWVKVRLHNIKPGDGILLRIAGLPMHVGIALGNWNMLHTEKGIGSCVEKFSSPLWRNRVIGAYRHADLIG